MASAPAGFGIVGVWLAGVPKAEGEARLSVASSVGISTGFANPGMSPATKRLFIIIMWAGRLDIVPVILLAAGAARRRL
jgi:L-lactate permease